MYLFIYLLSKQRDLLTNNNTFVCLPAGAANHHSQSTLRPPLPPPHNHQSLSHQSANSLNRNTLRGGRNPIHAPTPGTGDGPTTPESVQLQDSWVLNSNVPLETRSGHTAFPLFIFSLYFFFKCLSDTNNLRDKNHSCEMDRG